MKSSGRQPAMAANMNARGRRHSQRKNGEGVAVDRQRMIPKSGYRFSEKIMRRKETARGPA
jgi:hypothetical protein